MINKQITSLWEKEIENLEKGKSYWEAMVRKDQEKLQNLIRRQKKQKPKKENDRRNNLRSFFWYQLEIIFLRKVLQEDLPIRLVAAVDRRHQVRFLKYHSTGFQMIAIDRHLERFPKYHSKD